LSENEKLIFTNKKQSGLTSQPSMGALVACEDKTVKFNVRHSDLTQLSNYWEVIGTDLLFVVVNPNFDCCLGCTWAICSV